MVKVLEGVQESPGQVRKVRQVPISRPNRWTNGMVQILSFVIQKTSVYQAGRY